MTQMTLDVDYFRKVALAMDTDFIDKENTVSLVPRDAYIAKCALNAFVEMMETQEFDTVTFAGKTEDKNHHVYGKHSLITMLERAQAKYGHWTNEQLDEYKMSHGHCVKSKF